MQKASNKCFWIIKQMKRLHSPLAVYRFNNITVMRFGLLTWLFPCQTVTCLFLHPSRKLVKSTLRRRWMTWGDRWGCWRESWRGRTRWQRNRTISRKSSHPENHHRHLKYVLLTYNYMLKVLSYGSSGTCLPHI